MHSTFVFEKNGMSVVVLVSEDKITCTVRGKEVYQLINRETDEVSLASFSQATGGRTFLQREPKYFSQKIS